MALPSGGTTRFFGDIVDTIYSNHEQNCADIVDSIYNELITGTPFEDSSGTPEYTGAMKANWRTGIRPTSDVPNKAPKTVNQHNPKVFANPTLKKGKRYGVHYKYYIWNNTPYLPYVNAGINPLVNHPNRKVIAGTDFIQKAITKGVNKAQKGGF